MKRGLLVAMLTLCLVAPTLGQEVEKPRPLVEGGIYDKPFLFNVDDRAVFGGYLDAQARYQRVEGVLEEWTFKLERFNIFTYAQLSDRIRVAGELEFEDGGEEVKIELAVVDFEIHDALTFRGGMILSPLGRFNLAHDSPANELTDRPLVSTQIIPTTLSEPGMGFFGAFYPSARSRITYEAYLVNGLDDGIILADGEGTRIPAGKGNFEDNNNRPSLVSRVSVSPHPVGELAASIHTGPYNTYEVEGFPLEPRRDVTIFALDAEARWSRFKFQGEYARAWIEVPPQLGVQEDQQGVYLELSGKFLEGAVSALPRSLFRGVARYDFVDFDRSLEGDTRRRLTLGVNFRPIGNTVYKLDWFREWLRDSFNNQENAAALLFSVASYF